MYEQGEQTHTRANIFAYILVPIIVDSTVLVLQVSPIIESKRVLSWLASHSKFARREYVSTRRHRTARQLQTRVAGL